jgi:hypothetical protein
MSEANERLPRRQCRPPMTPPRRPDVLRHGTNQTGLWSLDVSGVSAQGVLPGSREMTSSCDKFVALSMRS